MSQSNELPHGVRALRARRVTARIRRKSASNILEDFGEERRAHERHDKAFKAQAVQNEAQRLAREIKYQRAEVERIASQAPFRSPWLIAGVVTIGLGAALWLYFAINPLDRNDPAAEAVALAIGFAIIFTLPLGLMVLIGWAQFDLASWFSRNKDLDAAQRRLELSEREQIMLERRQFRFEHDDSPIPRWRDTPYVISYDASKNPNKGAAL